MAALVTPLHWQMVARPGSVVGDCVAVAGLLRRAMQQGRPDPPGRAAPRSNSWVIVPAVRVSPSRIAPVSLPPRTTSFW